MECFASTRSSVTSEPEQAVDAALAEAGGKEGAKRQRQTSELAAGTNHFGSGRNLACPVALLAKRERKKRCHTCGRPGRGSAGSCFGERCWLGWHGGPGFIQQGHHLVLGHGLNGEREQSGRAVKLITPNHTIADVRTDVRVALQLPQKTHDSLVQSSPGLCISSRPTPLLHTNCMLYALALRTGALALWSILS